MDRHPFSEIFDPELSTCTLAPASVDFLGRLKKLENQIRDLQDMITANQPCADVAEQMGSARSVLDQTFYALVLRQTVNAKRASPIDEVARSEIERSAHLLDKLG